MIYLHKKTKNDDIIISYLRLILEPVHRRSDKTFWRLLSESTQIVITPSSLRLAVYRHFVGFRFFDHDQIFGYANRNSRYV